MRVYGVQAGEVADFWDFALAHLERVEGFDAEYALGLVQAKKWQLWLMVEGEDCLAAAITEVNEEPEKVVTIYAAAGERLALWRDALVAEVKAWGRSLGAEKTRIIGRDGWERAVRDLGFTRAAVVLEAPNNV